MTEQERKDLREKRDNSGLHPEIKTLRAGAWIMNAERTGDDKAALGGMLEEFLADIYAARIFYKVSFLW